MSHPIAWCPETIEGPNDLLDQQPHTRVWIERVEAIGHGNPTQISPAQTLEHALNATPAELSTAPDYDTPEGVALGEDVPVSPLDEDSPTTGRLIYHDDRRIVVRCTHQRVGEINVHFPRIGYRVRRRVR